MQGRIKRDGGAAGDPEQRGGAGGGSPQVAPGADATATAKPKGPAGDGRGGAGKGAAGDGSEKQSSRIRLRNWKISTRLVALLTLPVVAATTLGALRIQNSLEDVDQLEHMDKLTTLTERATRLADRLQDERDLTAGPLTRGREGDDSVAATREETDKAARSFLAESNLPKDDDALTGVRNTLVQIDTQLRELNRIRELAYDNPDYVSQTADSYSQLIEGLLSLSQDMAQATSNTEMIQATRALTAFAQSKEDYSIQRAVLAAALAHEGGPELSENDRYFARTTYQNEKSAQERFISIYGDDSAKLLSGLDGDVVEIELADEFRERAVNYPNGIKSQDLSYLDWIDKSTTRLDAMRAVQTELLAQMSRQAKNLRSEAQRDALLNGALILIVLGVAVIGAAVVARSMIRSLRRLQDTAQEVAQKRLPELVKHLSEADPQDIDTSVKSIGLNSRDEIGQVAKAFDEVHREAVRLASEQALLRGNVNAMFTNLSRRSQGLIQRQLSLISELESREADPDQLANLFKLDHLATRMRRNGENLLVLAGEEPGRRWTRPVPLVDVLRAAASEVEQYERIELTSVPSTEVAGRVVNDLVHLLAELLENATSFSSPQTKVKVTGHALPDGRVLIEIHDTGIGLSPEDLAEINERLANPPTVDVSVSRRMGLFVVGRLSLRHGIRIQLRPSDSGGTTALVMLPVDVTQGGGAPKSAGRPGQAPQTGAAPQRGQLSSLQTGGPGGPGASPAGGRDLPQRPVAGRPAQPQLPQQSKPQQQPQPQQSQQQPGQPPRRTLPPPPRPTRPQQPQPQAGQPHEPARPAPSAPQQPQQPQWTGMSGDQHRRDATPPAGTPLPPGAGRQPARRDFAETAQGDHDRVESTLQFEAVRDDQRPPLPRVPQQMPQPQAPQALPANLPPVQVPQPQAPQPQAPQPFPEQERQRSEPQLPPAAEPMALPPAPVSADERTPIFDTVESDWFRSRAADGAAPPAAPQAPAPQQRPQRAEPAGTGLPGPQPARPQRDRHTPPPRPAAQPQAARSAGASSGQWRPSSNDERWRRAEQVREPQAGGVTAAGLPRRVPRANLVPGKAQAPQTPQTTGHPQVSRAPDEVRGRLTNLRRGIQQGRQAGAGPTDGRGFRPNHQER
ncbi:hypothetical protein GCM10027168_74870 [Streptomyces capparidis]